MIGNRVEFWSSRKENHGMKRVAWYSVAVVVTAVVFAFAWSKHAEQQARQSRDAARAALLAAEPWRDSPEWRGITVWSKVSAPHPVWTAFENDPPAPQMRRAMVKKLSRRPGKYQVVAWGLSIERVTPISDGWETVVTVRPQLSGTAFTTSNSVETWLVSKSGSTRCLKCDPVDGMFVVD